MEKKKGGEYESFSRGKILIRTIHIFFFDSKFFDCKTTLYFVFLMLADELSVQLQLTTRH